MYDAKTNQCIVSLESIKEATQKLSRNIKNNEEQVTRLLESIQSYQTTEDELFKTYDCLENIEIEADHLTAGIVDMIASIPPVNLPLYSMIIFGAIPALMAKKLYMRPPTRMVEIYSELYKLLDVNTLFPQFVLVPGIERQEFADAYTSKADVVLFTGTHSNAARIMKCIRKDALFLYNGVGINPIVVFKNADIDSAVRNIVFTKSFNSGQDCAGPDSILVDEEIADVFYAKLQEAVEKLKVGPSYKDKSVVVGPLLEQVQLQDLTKVLSRNMRFIRYGGVIDYRHNIVNPTIIQKPLTEGCYYDELFAPIFFVQPFNATSFKEYFDTDHYTNFAMYVTYFGSNKELESVVRDSVVLRDTNIIEIERGNTAYGGYGYYASYVLCRKNKTPKPLLISKEIAEYLVTD